MYELIASVLNVCIGEGMHRKVVTPTEEEITKLTESRLKIGVYK